MFSLFKGTIDVTCNSRITKSSIDMNGGVITSAGLPINQTDVVNKRYIDNNVILVSVILSGISFSTVLTELQGALVISVKSSNSNGPSATFNLSKGNSNRSPSYTRSSSSAGDTTFERLVFSWDPGQPLKLKKTGVNYDGVYIVKIILNI